MIAKTAIVVGAGMAGLAAAKALAGHFENVVVVERDARPTAANARRGVPQGRQPHVLLYGGLAALCELFPNFRRDLQSAGAVPVSVGRDLRIEIPDVGALPRRELGFEIFSTTRPILEGVLRQRVASTDNIELRFGLMVRQVLRSADGSTLTGLLCRDSEGARKHLQADLVVDASGRGELTLACLGACGHGQPRETAIGVDLGYSTIEITLPAEVDFGFKALVTLPAAPESSRSGYLLQIGPTAWQAVLVGRGSEQPPGDFEAWRDFAAGLPTPTMSRVLAAARAPRRLARFRFPQSQWRHYGGLRTFPQGLVPLGDAIARFNPVHGQGMTVAAQQAVLLRDVLKEHCRRLAPLESAPRDFLTRAESLISLPWSVSAVPDLVYPEAVGERPDNLNELLQQHREAFASALNDPEAHRMLIERQHLIRGESQVAPRQAAVP